MHLEDTQPGSAVAGSGLMGADVTTSKGGVEPSSFAATGDR